MMEIHTVRVGSTYEFVSVCECLVNSLKILYFLNVAEKKVQV